MTTTTAIIAVVVAVIRQKRTKIKSRTNKAKAENKRMEK